MGREGMDADVVIVGGGVVGLHAAYKCALLNMKVLVIDKGRKWCRGYHVPSFHNIPMHPEGISGKDLIESLRRSCAQREDLITIIDFTTVEDVIRSVTPDGPVFTTKAVSSKNDVETSYRSRAVILCTGVIDRQPEIRGALRTILPYANKALAMYCPICDGHLLKGKSVGVLGHAGPARSILSTLRMFQLGSLTLLTNGRELMEGTDAPAEKVEKWKQSLSDHEVPLIKSGITGFFGIEKGVFGVVLDDGTRKEYDHVFVALGWYSMNTGLGTALGGTVDDEGFLRTDEDCRVLDGKGTPIIGLYAAGDIRNTWNQVPIGWGDAEKAVIDIRFEVL